MITLEGIGFKILELDETNYCEVLDENSRVIFTGRLVEASCENHCSYGRVQAKYQKIVIDDYFVREMEKGYLEKRAIKKGLEKICKDNDDMLYMDMDENVDVIYDTLKKEGVVE